MLGAIKTFNDAAFEALEAGVPVEEITDIDAAPRLNRMGTAAEYDEFIDELEADIESQLEEKY
jgi:V/A-type H+-transporting ATPase subunit A